MVSHFYFVDTVRISCLVATSIESSYMGCVAGAGFFVCKLKKMSNAKKEAGEGGEAESDEEVAPPVEDWDAEDAARAREQRAAAKRGKGEAASSAVPERRAPKRRSFNLEQSGVPGRLSFDCAATTHVNT